MLTSPERTSSGIPFRICGIGSDLTVTAAVIGSTLRAVADDDVPRSNGPATAGAIDDDAHRGALVGAREVGLAGGA